ncbi:MAG: hypothetical protein WCI84_00550 [Bacteroidota bacterium]
MKKYLFLVLAVTMLVTSSAQKKSAPDAKGGAESAVKGGVGMTWIDGEAYYLVSLAPEIAFGNWGMGLDLNLHISSKDQKIRKQDFDETYDYLRIIRYLRYGTKGDEIYVRVGALDYSKLGHGFILYNYKNSPSYDTRKIGAEFDLDFGQWGLETVYGDFASSSVLGMRGYTRPLQFTPAASIPVIGGLEVGATFASDMRSDSRDTGVVVKANGTKFDTTTYNTGSLSIIGLDLGLPLFNLPVADATLYLDYAKIFNFGSGFATGIDLNFSAVGVLKVYSKFERRFGQTDKFIPAYFDAFYELERYQLSSGSFHSKAKTLEQTISPGPGYFGSLLVDVLGTLQIEGSYQKLDLNPTSGVLHLGTNTGDKIPLVSLSAGYDKRNIQNNKDVFTLDGRSLLYAEVGYKPYPFMIVSTLYTWTFAPVKDSGGNITGYQPQKRITPKVSFVFPL